MFGKLAKAVFGSSNDRYVKSLDKIVKQIAAFETNFEAMSEEELTSQTAKFRAMLADGAELDDLLPEAFATVREASKRVLGMRHFDVQMIGGMVLHRGEIAEMKTGEGKTLVATLAVYLNALEGKGVHVVTVNDYLARRDADWMGQIYTYLGLTVGVIVPNLAEEERREAYNCDITYATNNELGFDYLRDNMKQERGQMVHRPFNYAIVDEVDSILIDEARTPLIISGPTDDKSELYVSVDAVVKQLTEDLYEKDEKTKNITLTEEGVEWAERRLEEAGLLVGSNLYDVENTQVVHHLDQALKAVMMFKRDTDYIVKDGKAVIIDEFTGRMMDGRRWSNGLHQAVEAKEGIQIEPENQTMASITFQNYFRMYPKLSGMTGTAATEAAEFFDIYKMNVVSIPTNVPVQRIDEEDEFYKNTLDKFAAIAKRIREQNEKGQPVLVGTVSIEKSELLSEFLEKEGVVHNVLNARFHEMEAHIVAQAGRLGAVTIATNMAGRGTDIKLGGNLEFRIDDELKDMPEGPEREAAIAKMAAEIEAEKQAVLDAGGLFVLGTEGHESRRIDNQLRGRSGRQGDPGSSRFYLSLEDPLLRIFAGERLNAIMVRLKMPEGEAIEHPLVTRSLESAQRKVEQRNFDIRKQLLEYDDVSNDQRKVIYQQRNELLETDEISETITAMRQGVLHDTFRTYVPADSVEEQWDIPGAEAALTTEYQLPLPIGEWLKTEPNLSDDDIVSRIIEEADRIYAAKVELVGAESFHHFERNMMLQSLDTHWREHLAALDHLRQGIHLRGYAQKNPKQEYKREAFELFEDLLQTVRNEVSKLLMTVEIRSQEQIEASEPHQAVENVQYHHSDYDEALGRQGEAERPAQPLVRHGQKVGRNDPCSCGSGKKYKHCHGKHA